MKGQKSNKVIFDEMSKCPRCDEKSDSSHPTGEKTNPVLSSKE